MTSSGRNIGIITLLPKQTLYKNLYFDMQAKYGIRNLFSSVIYCQSKASGKKYFRFLPKKSHFLKEVIF